MNFTGTSGKDNLAGTTGDDIFDMSQGGNDTVDGDDGNDVVKFGATLTAKDVFDGGDGTDEVQLDGDYSAGLTLAKHSFTSVERLVLSSGHTYDIAFVDKNASGAFAVVGSLLGAGDQLIFHGTKETDCAFSMFGGAGDDVLRGGHLGDSFSFQLGGADAAYGGDGSDDFTMFAEFDAGDTIRGGADSDIVTLLGDYSGGLTLTHAMMQDGESFHVGGAFDYAISTEDALVAAGGSLTVATGGVALGNSATFDGSAETDGSFFFTDGAIDDSFIGGDGDDTFFLFQADDFADGGDGDDLFYMLDGFGAGDTLDGHHGDDTLELQGDYSAGVTLLAGTIHSVETISFASGVYSLTMDDANVGAGDTLAIDGALTDGLTFNGSAELDGTFEASGGDFADLIVGGSQADTISGLDGDDTLNGRAGDDMLNGGAGADHLNGAIGGDTFAYTAVSESTGADHDILGTFNTAVDRVDLPGGLNAVDSRINAGTLNAGNFDADMVVAVNSGNLGIGNAVIFQANAGDLSGHKYLIIDANGSAGYQAGVDYVIEIDQGFALNSLSTANFI